MTKTQSTNSYLENFNVYSKEQQEYMTKSGMIPCHDQASLEGDSKMLLTATERCNHDIMLLTMVYQSPAQVKVFCTCGEERVMMHHEMLIWLFEQAQEQARTEEYRDGF